MFHPNIPGMEKDGTWKKHLKKKNYWKEPTSFVFLTILGHHFDVVRLGLSIINVTIPAIGNAPHWWPHPLKGDEETSSGFGSHLSFAPAKFWRYIDPNHQARLHDLQILGDIHRTLTHHNSSRNSIGLKLLKLLQNLSDLLCFAYGLAKRTNNS